MDKALPDALVSGYEHLVDGLELPDLNDRHVLAAAIHGGANVIVTLNLSDFPKQNLRSFNLEARHPDDFAFALLETDTALVLEAAANHRSSLRNPPKTPEAYLEELNSDGLARTAAALRLIILEQVFVI
jgi:hypothetical protein